MSFNTWSCSKYWPNPSKTLSGYFKLLKCLQREVSPLIPGKFQHVTYDIFDHLAKFHENQGKENSTKPINSMSAHFQV
jgi:hypothetical protein